ncbi:hypothetical protein D3C81_2147630 [compost metagenome]
MALGMADGGQAVGQHARFTVDLDAQIVRRSLQRAAAQDQLQLRIEFRALQRRAQALPQAVGVPAELALGHGVEVLQMALAVDHQ